MENLISDIRFAGKTLSRNPGFALGAILCLALALGVGTILFLFVYATLLRPLPVPDPDRLVWIASQTGSSFNSSSYPDFLDLERRTDVFSGVVAYTGTRMALRGEDRTELVRGQLVSTNYFSVFGLRPILGRGFRTGGAAAEREPEVVLSHALWQRRFGADPEIVGKPIFVVGHPFTVVGVAPESFRGTQFMYGNNDLWIPVLAFSLARKDIAESFTERGSRRIELMGRLQPGVRLEQAQAAVSRKPTRRATKGSFSASTPPCSAIPRTSRRGSSSPSP
jgi:hypothetical protein